MDLDRTEESSACCLHFCHNKLKLLQHCELNGLNFLVFSLQTKKKYDQNPCWDSSKPTLWQSMGRERGFHTAQPAFVSQTSQSELPNKISDLPTFCGGKVLNFQKTVL